MPLYDLEVTFWKAMSWFLFIICAFMLSNCLSLMSFACFYFHFSKGAWNCMWSTAWTLLKTELLCYSHYFYTLRGKLSFELDFCLELEALILHIVWTCVYIWSYWQSYFLDWDQSI